MMSVRGCSLGEAAPAAADLENVGFCFREMLENAAIFLLLRLLEIDFARAVERGGIGHASIEPQFVEVVADIVVILDVTAASAQAVSANEFVVQNEPHAV